MRQWAIYKITCLTCGEADITSEYIDESARTLFDKGLEHYEALQNRNEESPLVEHEIKCHEK